MKTVALYREKDPVNLNAGIELQKKSCREFAKERNLEIIHEYVDTSWNAEDTSLHDADVLSEIRGAAKARDMDVLLVYSFYCIGREDVETPVAIQALLKIGVQVLSVMEGSFV